MIVRVYGKQEDEAASPTRELGPDVHEAVVAACDRCKRKALLSASAFMQEDPEVLYGKAIRYEGFQRLEVDGVELLFCPQCYDAMPGKPDIEIVGV